MKRLALGWLSGVQLSCIFPFRNPTGITVTVVFIDTVDSVLGGIKICQEKKNLFQKRVMAYNLPEYSKP